MRAPSIAAFYCVYDDDEWLPYSVTSIYDAVDKIYFLVNDRPWNGPATGNERTLSCIRSQSDSDAKIQVVRGDWATEVEQRNFAMALITNDGFDYGFIIDADEIYETGALTNCARGA